ncbi:hypothetical protein BS78_06G144100 [Paspalum vaginatum]|nr:hypothetical protein BS78_06G144100 [Paspalum vaginatum]
MNVPSVSLWVSSAGRSRRGGTPEPAARASARRPRPPCPAAAGTRGARRPLRPSTGPCCGRPAAGSWRRGHAVAVRLRLPARGRARHCCRARLHALAVRARRRPPPVRAAVRLTALRLLSLRANSLSGAFPDDLLFHSCGQWRGIVPVREEADPALPDQIWSSGPWRNPLARTLGRHHCTPLGTAAAATTTEATAEHPPSTHCC